MAARTVKAKSRLPSKDNLFITAILAGAMIFCYLTVVAPALGKSDPAVVNNPPTKPAVEAPVVSENDPATKDWLYNFANYPDDTLLGETWHFELGSKVANYHDELQTYTARRSNVRIKNGELIIEARKEALDGKQYTSGRISTLGNFSFTYGTLEVEIMMPQGKGTWPAAWLMPRNNKYAPHAFGIAKNDPLAWAINGEIDFAEGIGRLPGQNIPAVHSYNELQRQPTYTPAFVKNQYTEYHKYGVIKTPTKITFTVDGVPYASREKTSNSPLEWPFNQPYYLILNLAVGGDWAGTHGIDNNAPWQMKVKSISYKASY